MRFGSWNVNGIRSILTKTKNGDKIPPSSKDVEENVLSTLLLEKRLDVLCLQEIRTSDSSFITSLPQDVKEYSLFSIRKKGYSGVTILTKLNVVGMYQGFALFEDEILPSEEEKRKEFLYEGRLITLELEDYIIVNVYTPNSQDELKRLDDRMKWDTYFSYYIYLLRGNFDKKIIICGDFNVAVDDIDIFSPSSHHHSAGFSDEERESFRLLLKENDLIDTFRYLHPEEREMYTYFSNRFQSRKKNRGWRIDYFLVEKKLKSSIVKSEILNNYYGSDHCPIILEMK